MVAECTERYGKVKLILRNDRYYIECPGDGAAFDALLHDTQEIALSIHTLSLYIHPSIHPAIYIPK